MECPVALAAVQTMGGRPIALVAVRTMGEWPIALAAHLNFHVVPWKLATEASLAVEVEAEAAMRAELQQL